MFDKLRKQIMFQRVTSVFSGEIFVVSHIRKFSYVYPSVLCFTFFPVAKKFMDTKGWISSFSV